MTKDSSICKLKADITHNTFISDNKKIWKKKHKSLLFIKIMHEKDISLGDWMTTERENTKEIAV